MMLWPLYLYSKKRLCLSAVLLLKGTGSFLGLPGPVVADQSVHVLGATLEHRFNPTQQVLDRSRVVVNGDGYRLDALPIEQGLAIIANMSMGKTWFVDTRRSYRHEVPFSTVDEAPELEEPFISLPGFIDSMPCSLLGGKRLGDVFFKGQALQRWRCSGDQSDHAAHDDLPEEQYYSSEYKMVVYSRSHGNIVSELLNINEHRVDPVLFVAPTELQDVTIEQFLGQIHPLSPYQPTLIINSE